MRLAATKQVLPSADKMGILGTDLRSTNNREVQ